MAALLSDATVRDLFDEAGCGGTFCAARLDAAIGAAAAYAVHLLQG